MKKLILASALATTIAVFGLWGSAGAAYAHPKLHQWYAQEGGKQSLKAIGKDIAAVSTAGNDENTSALGSACQSLEGDIQIAQALKPIPSSSLQRFWATVLSDYSHGATECINGTNDESASELDQSASDFTSGSSVLAHLNNQL